MKNKFTLNVNEALVKVNMNDFFRNVYIELTSALQSVNVSTLKS